MCAHVHIRHSFVEIKIDHNFSTSNLTVVYLPRSGYWWVRVVVMVDWRIVWWVNETWSLQTGGVCGEWSFTRGVSHAEYLKYWVRGSKIRPETICHILWKVLEKITLCCWHLKVAKKAQGETRLLEVLWELWKGRQTLSLASILHTYSPWQLSADNGKKNKGNVIACFISLNLQCCGRFCATSKKEDG